MLSQKKEFRSTFFWKSLNSCSVIQKYKIPNIKTTLKLPLFSTIWLNLIFLRKRVLYELLDKVIGKRSSYTSWNLYIMRCQWNWRRYLCVTSLLLTGHESPSLRALKNTYFHKLRGLYFNVIFISIKQMLSRILYSK